MIRLTCLAVSITLAGCTLNFGDDGDDIVCRASGSEDSNIAIAAFDLVNPQNLQCELFGGGCGPCGCLPGDPVPVPTWGQCQSPCTGLDEATCMVATGCRATYDRNCYLTDGICPLLTPYLGCYAVDTLGPIQGACPGLDAQECSKHDDCLGLYTQACDANGVNCLPSYAECYPEPLPPCGGDPACG